jgi:predicted nucleotidyltransferase
MDVELRQDIIGRLRSAGARFAFLHGSQVSGTVHPASDVDVAAWWPSSPPPAFEVLLPPLVDLLVLNSAPLELAGRVALHGRLLFDDDPAARVRWVASTRKVYADERYRLLRSEREFAEGIRRGR